MYYSLFFNKQKTKTGKTKEATFSLTCTKQTLNKLLNQLQLEEVYYWQSSLAEED
jgi:hypothetical protein